MPPSCAIPIARRASVTVSLRDAGLHRSPNAGWPEAAFAGALAIALGGPRVYASESVPQAWLNAAARHELDTVDIDRALKLFGYGCFSLWAAGALAVVAC